MLSMVNANRFITRRAIPLVLVAYAVFIWIDHTYSTRDEYDPEVKVHMQNVKNGRSVDALVFGGSNAVYSLSAEYLSYNTGLNWGITHLWAPSCALATGIRISFWTCPLS
jgi:hypothetical protein